MNWYVVKIVYRIICGNGDHVAQFDEQLLLMSALDEEHAFYKARHSGLKHEEFFYNLKGQLVQWRFINVSELRQIGELEDGVELYSRIEEKDDGDAYTDVVNNKAQRLLQSRISAPSAMYSIANPFGFARYDVASLSLAK